MKLLYLLPFINAVFSAGLSKIRIETESSNPEYDKKGLGLSIQEPEQYYVQLSDYIGTFDYNETSQYINSTSFSNGEVPIYLDFDIPNYLSFGHGGIESVIEDGYLSVGQTKSLKVVENNYLKTYGEGDSVKLKATIVSS